jgi:hypothetical protein
MEKSDDIKAPGVVDRAKEEVVAIADTVHDALHSVRKGHIHISFCKIFVSYELLVG